MAWMGTGWCHQGSLEASCRAWVHMWDLIQLPHLGLGSGQGCLSLSSAWSQQPLGRQELALVPSASSLSSQMCKKREKRLPDATLEKYVLTVVLDTINAFFSSPFSENSTSLQVTRVGRVAGGTAAQPDPQNTVWVRVLTLLSPPDPPDHRGAAPPVHHEAAGVSLAAAAAQELGGVLHPHAGHGW